MNFSEDLNLINWKQYELIRILNVRVEAYYANKDLRGSGAVELAASPCTDDLRWFRLTLWLQFD